MEKLVGKRVYRLFTRITAVKKHKHKNSAFYHSLFNSFHLDGSLANHSMGSVLPTLISNLFFNYEVIYRFALLYANHRFPEPKAALKPSDVLLTMI